MDLLALITWWHKHSNPNGACVEVALTPDGLTVAVRHSRHPEGPVIRYTKPEWISFLAGVEAGEFTWDALVARWDTAKVTA